MLRTLWLVPVLLLAGALLDPAIIAPFGPIAAPAERVAAQFRPCGPLGGTACVIDGDSFKLGMRMIRITGIDAPEKRDPLCAAERSLALKSADRLVELLNGGEFEMVAHRFHRRDRFGRELMVVRRGDQSIGSRLVNEGLAHRYLGSKRSWC